MEPPSGKLSASRTEFRLVLGFLIGVLMKSVKSWPAHLAFALCAVSAFAQSPTQGSGNASRTESSGPSTSTAAKQAHDATYVIGNDDHLTINVWKETELSKSVTVRSDGKISLPLVGEIQASGRTPLQLESDISSRLRSFITAPEVTVIVDQINSKKYNMVGYISRPGSYPLTLSTTIMDAISNAGGLKDFAKEKNIYILRRNADGTQSRINFNYKDFIKGKNIEQNIKVQPDDTIIVP
jgi:polysaccharide biosynthesis/export protein